MRTTGGACSKEGSRRKTLVTQAFLAGARAYLKKKISNSFFDMLDKIFLTVYKSFSERLDRNSDSFTRPAAPGYAGILGAF